jgi:hypothetical protein
VGVATQGLKKPFAFENQKDNVLGYEAFKELKCLFIGLSCNIYK